MCGAWGADSIGPVRVLHLGSILVFFVTAALDTMGCNVESIWKVPTFPSERPSRLWSTDPRTSGWKGVEVEYALLADGGVDATVRSTDGRHQLKERGTYWYENEQGGKPESYKDQAYLVVEFDGRQEKYRFAHPPGSAWGHLVLVEPNAPDSEPAAIAGTPQQTALRKSDAVVGTENQGDAFPRHMEP